MKHIRLESMLRIIDHWYRYISEGISRVDDCADYDGAQVEVISTLISKLRIYQLELEDHKIMLQELKKKFLVEVLIKHDYQRTLYVSENPFILYMKVILALMILIWEM